MFHVAPVGRQHAAMSVHAARCWHGVKVVAVYRVPHPLAVDVAPQGAQLLRLALREIRHRADTGAVEAFFHARPDAWDGFERQFQKRGGHCGRMPQRHAVRLVHLARDFREQAVRGETDRAGDVRADVAANALFYARREIKRCLDRIGEDRVCLTERIDPVDKIDIELADSPNDCDFR
jgi:hypothetical protein